MYCIKCGKEIPESEDKICEECKMKQQEETKNELKKESVKTEETQNEVKEKEEMENKKEDKKKKKDNTKKENKKPEKTKSESKKNNKDSKNTKNTTNDKKTLIISGLLILTLLVVAILIVCMVIIPKFSNNSTTIGNIRNYGYTAQDGNWIYYVAPNEDSTEIGIFKIKTNGESKEQLYMGDLNIVSLNVKGNYVYFIGIGSEEYSENDASDNKIYRMKTDGSEVEVINDNEFHNACLEMYVIDNYIYYIGTDQNIYKMKLDGTKRELVSDNETGYLGITNKYIFYNFDETGNEEYVTYIMNLDGSNPRPIIEGKRLYSIDIKGDYVYYTNADKELYRTKIDSNKEELYDKVSAAYNLNLNGDYLYYLNYENSDSSESKVCIYRVTTDDISSEPQKIKTMENASQFINVVDDYVYYMDYNNESGFINLVKTDGSEEIIQLYLLVYSDYFETDETEESVSTENTTNTENVVSTDSVANETNTISNNITNETNVPSTTNTVSQNTTNNSVIENVTNTNTVLNSATNTVVNQ